jgi:hypothetical protein
VHAQTALRTSAIAQRSPQLQLMSGSGSENAQPWSFQRIKSGSTWLQLPPQPAIPRCAFNDEWHQCHLCSMTCKERTVRLAARCVHLGQRPHLTATSPLVTQLCGTSSSVVQGLCFSNELLQVPVASIPPAVVPQMRRSRRQDGYACRHTTIASLTRPESFSCLIPPEDL